MYQGVSGLGGGPGHGRGGFFAPSSRSARGSRLLRRPRCHTWAGRGLGPSAVWGLAATERPPVREDYADAWPGSFDRDADDRGHLDGVLEKAWRLCPQACRAPEGLEIIGGIMSG